MSAGSFAIPRPAGAAPGACDDLLKGGGELFPALVEAIDGAPRRGPARDLHLRVRRRGAARSPRRWSARRARREGEGGRRRHRHRRMPRPWCERWQEAGVHWRVYHPARGWACLPGSWRRLHRKLCVVDEQVAFCGGINLLDDYHDPNHGPLEEPRFDFAVRVTGPLVADAHETMTRLWLRMQATRDIRNFDCAGALDVAARFRAPRAPPEDQGRAQPPRTPTAARRPGAARQPALSRAHRALLPLRHRPGAGARSSSPTPTSFPAWRCAGAAQRRPSAA